MKSSRRAAAGLSAGVIVGVVEGHRLGGVDEVVLDGGGAHPTLLHRGANALLVLFAIVLIKLCSLTVRRVAGIRGEREWENSS